MEIVKKIFKTSLLDIFLSFIFMFIVINVILFIYTLIQGTPRFFVTDDSWVIQFIWPILYAVYWSNLQKNETLVITYYNDLPDLKAKLHCIVKNIGYEIKVSDSDVIIYSRKILLGRILNIFFRKDIIIKESDDCVIIHSRRITLSKLEKMLQKEMIHEKK